MNVKTFGTFRFLVVIIRNFKRTRAVSWPEPYGPSSNADEHPTMESPFYSFLEDNPCKMDMAKDCWALRIICSSSSLHKLNTAWWRTSAHLSDTEYQSWCTAVLLPYFCCLICSELPVIHSIQMRRGKANNNCGTLLPLYWTRSLE